MKPPYVQACLLASQKGDRKFELAQEIYGEVMYLTLDTEICQNIKTDRDERRIERHIRRMFMDKYRGQKGIITTSRIMSLRKQLRLNQRDFARLLGLGEITIARYEAGYIPTRSNASRIEQISDLSNLVNFYKENKDDLTEKGQKRVEAYISSYTKVDNGGRVFDAERFNDLVGYIAFLAQEAALPLTLVKCAKILFYSDFMAYKLFNKAITGSSYIRLNFGEAPQDYIYGLELSSNVELTFKDNQTLVSLQTAYDASINRLTRLEKELVLNIFEHVKVLDDATLIERNQSEKGYQKTALGHVISYKYAQDYIIEIEV